MLNLVQKAAMITPKKPHWRQAYFLVTAFKRKAFNAQAAWLRCLNGAAFASLKKYPSDFFNPPLADRTERGAL